jgi:hypothetical protein
MFPTARNSLRRWSEHYHNKIPIPIAVTLHNFLLNDQVVSHAQTQYGRIEHNSNLLPPITLEIIVSENNVVFSETTQNVHPSWEHLDERIGLPGEWWLKDDSGIYKTMKLRFYLPNHKLLLEIPIYPASLQKLDSDETPEALPPNSCFIYFSDGSTRLPESIFQILLDQKLTTLPPIEDFSRFEDDVFRTLDTVAQTPERKRRSDSLLDGEQEPKTLFPKTTTPTTTQTVIPFDHSEQDILQGDFKQEAASLEALIAQEEQALQDELEALNEVNTNATQASSPSVHFRKTLTSTFSLLAAKNVFGQLGTKCQIYGRPKSTPTKGNCLPHQQSPKRTVFQRGPTNQLIPRFANDLSHFH